MTKLGDIPETVKKIKNLLFNQVSMPRMPNFVVIWAQWNKIIWVVILIILIHVVDFYYQVKLTNTATLIMMIKTNRSVVVAIFMVGIVNP